nr:hypothetical protein [uncultured Sphingobacterium sp.]
MSTPNPVYLSICIPAYGRIDYVRRTLKSIYSERHLDEVKIEDFEVIVSDNDPECSLKVLTDEFPYSNFRYHATNCEGFMNSAYSLGYGLGEFLKLHNNQEIWNPGSLPYLIDVVKKKRYKKPLLFFTSGILGNGDSNEYASFDGFMYHLSYFCTWSNGFCIWREDFEKIDKALEIDLLFPQTSLLLTQNSSSSYIIDDHPLFTTQFVKKRSGYNKFEAFSVGVPSMIESAYKKNLIKESTKKRIFNDLLYEFLPLLYFNVKIARRENFASDGFREKIKIYFPVCAYPLVVTLSFFIPFKILWRKFKTRYILKYDFV